MTRNLSTSALAEMFRVSGSDPFLPLLTIDMYTTKYYLVANIDAVVSRGITYSPWPFNLNLPDEVETEQNKTTIRIDNVDPVLWKIARSLSNPPLITLELILASQPDYILLVINNMKLREGNADKTVIEATLMIDTIWQLRYPSDTYTATQFPGMFR